MSVWRQFRHGIRSLIHRTAADRALDDEIQHYLDRAIEANISRGMSPDEARRAARLEMGGPLLVREQVRSSGWENALETSFADFRYALRRLRGALAFALVAIVTLALGIGASTAIFSVVKPILFEPLPYPNSAQIVTLWDFGPGSSRLEGTFGTHRELVARSHAFDSFSVLKSWQPTLTGGTSEPERLDGQLVSADYFRVLGVQPVLGRNFEPDDDRAGGPNVVIINDALWRRRFGADPSVPGRAITLDGGSYTVVGVLPAGFENVLSPTAEVWGPLQYDMSQGRAWGHHLRMIGRLKRGVKIDEAARDIAAIAGNPVAEFPRQPWAALRNGLLVRSLREDVTAAVKPAMTAVLAAVVLLLTIACINVTNLVLARNARRRGEFGMRTALGAGRFRLLRQLLIESLTLALLGGVVGVLAATFGVRVLVALSPPGIPRLDAVHVDGIAVVFATATTTFLGLFVGLIPALHLSRRDLQGQLQEDSSRTTTSHSLARTLFVTAEVALAAVLLVNAGLLLRSLQRLFAIDPGFDASQLLTMQIQTIGQQFRDDNVTRQYFAQVESAVGQVSGVTSVALTSQLPLSGDVDEYGVLFEGDDPNRRNSAYKYDISPGYFETIGIPILRGRSPSRGDVGGAPSVALISESLAKLRFGTEDPIGKRANVPPNDTSYAIIGVVGDVKQTSLTLRRSDAVYIPSAQTGAADRTLWLVVHTKANAGALAPSVKAAVWSVDRNQPIVRVATMASRVENSAAERRFALLLFETFAVTALVLAATGVYGVLSGRVSERTREIGIRTALGASRTTIVLEFMRHGLSRTGLGVALGLVGAAVASRTITPLLFEISRLDPATYLVVAAVLSSVSAIACVIPAWRASRVDPSITLRSE